MKKLLLLLLILPFVACSDDEKETEPTQDYTSVVFEYTSDVVLYNSVIGIKLQDGTFKKVAELGDLKPNTPSKEVVVDYAISEVYLFTDYNGVIRFNKIFKLERNKKNIIILDDIGGIGVKDKTDPTEYPQ